MTNMMRMKRFSGSKKLINSDVFPELFSFEMIHTHNDNSVNFLSPGSGGRGGGEDFGDHLVVRGT